MSALCLALSFATLYWGRGWDTILFLLGVIGPFGLLLVIAFLTDDAAG